MPKYLCLQRKLSSGAGEAASPTDMEALYARFREWQQTFEDNIYDLGGKLGDGTLVTDEIESDGPFVEVKELISGFMIVSAESLDEAAKVARTCPGLVRPGSGVEIIEIHTK